MSEDKEEKPKLVVDYINEIFLEIKEMKQSFGDVIEADRKQMNEMAKSLNAITAEVNAANTARAATPTQGKGKGIKLGAGAQGFIEMVTKLGTAVINNPQKFFGESKPEDAMYKQHKALMDQAFVANITNTMELGKLEVARRKAEIARISKTGWGIRGNR